MYVWMNDKLDFFGQQWKENNKKNNNQEAMIKKKHKHN